jgi:hypothetical protein
MGSCCISVTCWIDFLLDALDVSGGTRMFKFQAADPSHSVEPCRAGSSRVCNRFCMQPATNMKIDFLFSPLDQAHRQYGSGLANGRGADVSFPARIWRAQPIVLRIAPAPRHRKTVAVSRQSVKISTAMCQAPARDGSYPSAFAARFSTSAGRCVAEANCTASLTVS